MRCSSTYRLSSANSACCSADKCLRFGDCERSSDEVMRAVAHLPICDMMAQRFRCDVAGLPKPDWSSTMSSLSARLQHAHASRSLPWLRNITPKLFNVVDRSSRRMCVSQCRCSGDIEDCELRASVKVSACSSNCLASANLPLWTAPSASLFSDSTRVRAAASNDLLLELIGVVRRFTLVRLFADFPDCRTALRDILISSY